MENLLIKYNTYASALPPRPIRIVSGGWAGPPVKMEDGSDPQPWHCLPFIEASTYGLELIYPFENECHVVNDDGKIRIDWDYAGEPSAGVTGGEFVLFSPVQASKYYLFNTRLDLQTPPGYVLRTEPHPRFFTDDTGTVPLSMIGHLQNEWYPRMVFVVFRAPLPGRRHIFRKGEPFVQLIFVPLRTAYDITKMSPAEATQRRDLEQAIQLARFDIAENKWRHPDGVTFNNHYKLLARAFARAGMPGVDEVVQDAVKRHELALPEDMSVAKSLALGSQLLDQQKFEQAQEVFFRILSKDPNNAEALSHAGICFACTGNMIAGLNVMAQAVALQPRVARFHINLGELLRRVGRYQEAESSVRSALQLSPNDPNILGQLGLLLAHQGRFAEGFSAYKAATGLGCSMPGTHFHMGLVLAEQGQFEEARTCFQAALRAAPDFTPAQQALQELPAPT